MSTVRERLRAELSGTLQRIHRGDFGSGSEQCVEVMTEELTDDDQPAWGCPSPDHEIGFATRSLLIERASRLARALERLEHGEYGLCQECGAAIAVERLRVMPEATTCVACQERLEAMSWSARVSREALAADSWHARGAARGRRRSPEPSIRRASPPGGDGSRRAGRVGE